ncbi:MULTISPECIES: hypothetical protein [Streptomyces]|uniref:hypothetical protein n=1 Tax=Streptomyces TaxID=1883 RepID=UPI00163B892A|nr:MULTISPECIES: hypothetical protein [Streptomyces]MBC2877295.1 hypothetical protein [Streptomyces sp. TYQ1024]UBI38107.1 hypothetical protein K7I03_17690 [Streptomyces mobaraensis]UKW30692.1 hypothetical protein MCU78_17645 [Streptomyces sp. TYQ1024]
MHRPTAPRLARLLACAAVPVMLVAGCSDSDGGKKSSSNSATPSASAPAKSSATPPATAGKYAKVPDLCKALSAKTVENLVPKVKDKKGELLTGSCFWNGLDSEDTDNQQFRSVNLHIMALSGDPNMGSADKRAQTYADGQVKKATTEDDPKDVKTAKTAGIGDWASTVTTTTKKKDVEFSNVTVVTRTANVVVALKYSGAGYEGAKSPSAADLTKDAQAAAKEAVASVAAANKK